MSAMDVRVGDVLRMKKPHPCGSQEFTVLRVGMDFKIRCNGCGREVMIPRLKCEKEYQEGPPSPRGSSSGLSLLRTSQRLERLCCICLRT